MEPSCKEHLFWAENLSKSNMPNGSVPEHWSACSVGLSPHRLGAELECLARLNWRCLPGNRLTTLPCLGDYLQRSHVASLLCNKKGPPSSHFGHSPLQTPQVDGTGTTIWSSDHHVMSCHVIMSSCHVIVKLAVSIWLLKLGGHVNRLNRLNLHHLGWSVAVGPTRLALNWGYLLLQRNHGTSMKRWKTGLLRFSWFSCYRNTFVFLIPQPCPWPRNGERCSSKRSLGKNDAEQIVVPPFLRAVWFWTMTPIKIPWP